MGYRVVNSALIADGTVGGADIACGAVGTCHLASCAVTAAKIACGAVAECHLGTCAVTAAKIHACAVGTSHIANGAVRAYHLCSSCTYNANGFVGGSLSGSHIEQCSTCDYLKACGNLCTDGVADFHSASGLIVPCCSYQTVDGALRWCCFDHRLQVYCGCSWYCLAICSGC